MSWKLDGLTLVLTYDGGRLMKILTRGNGSVGMESIAMRSKRADGHTVFFKGGHKLVELFRVGKQCLGITVCLAGVATCTNLHSGHSKRGEDRKSFVKGFGAIKIGKNA